MSIHPITYVTVDLSAIVSNYRRIRADAGCDVLCIVKADGYGHGAIPCAIALHEAGARWFGVANAGEAVALREGMGERQCDILILGYTDPADAPILVSHRITQTVYSYEYAAALLSNLEKEHRLSVHIKLDSGMNRLGFPTDEARRGETVAQIKALHEDPRLELCGLFTHFACADEPEHPMTDWQWARFSDTADALEAAGISFPIVHACNSAGIYRIPQARGNLVRAGIILYGIQPSDQTDIAGLTPAMALHTRVTHIHHVKAGETVGYGASFTAPSPMRIATLAIGYADGLVRAYHDGPVSVGGILCPIVGRICMDQCMVDVTGHPSVKVGDDAIFFDASHPIAALSRAAGMIPYETVCLIGKRVPRIYM